MNSRKDLKRGYSRYNYNNIINNNNMVKEKANSIRMYDSEGYRRRAACICVKSDLEDEVSQLADGSHLYLCRHAVVVANAMLEPASFTFLFKS